MAEHSYQEILNFVTSPSQYLGTETNRIKKNPDKVDLKIALAFPDLYEIGTSHFGIQILYSLLNARNYIAAERVYCPPEDMRRLLIEKKKPLLSLESSMPLERFDIVGFSLLYELNYTNILTILRLSNIPFFSELRNENHPLIIAGGPCACNPEPAARFFDAVVFGDGENVCLEMADRWIACKKQGDGTKREILDEWRQIKGVYVPSFFEETKTKIGDSETVVVKPTMEDYGRIDRAILANLNEAFFPESPVVAFGKPVHDRLRIEIARGCSRGCRFCQAGMIYRPVRERDENVLFEMAEKCLRTTGYEDISLLSLSTGDYSRIEHLLGGFMEKYGPKNIAVSLPSLRAGTLTRSLMETIKKVRKTGFTIAPEAGSQRLRDVINKNITEDQILETVDDAVRAGWKVIKLYFMIGLPTETQDDLHDIVRLIENAKKLKGPGGKKIKINASFTTFIPKPHTPFQWAGQAPPEYSRNAIDMLKDGLRGKRVQVKWQNPETSRIEGLFARGDRKLADLLVRAWESGCRLDGWSDFFRYDLWVQSAEQTGIDIDYYTTRQRDLREPLPWDHMNSRVEKRFLAEEWKKALLRQRTPDCRGGDCQDCGVCDFVDIEPVSAKEEFLGGEIGEGPSSQQEQGTAKFMATYSKTGRAKHFGHLEMVNIFLRAMRRANIPVVFSAGFHPMPKVSFDDPLPVGMESLREKFFVTVRKDFRAEGIVDRMNDTLPGGLAVTGWEKVDAKRKFEKDTTISYTVDFEEARISNERLNDFESMREFILTKTGKKGKIKEIDLKKAIDKISILSENRVWLRVVAEPGKNPRPAEILKAVFGIADKEIKRARVVKLDARKDCDVQTIGNQRFRT